MQDADSEQEPHPPQVKRQRIEAGRLPIVAIAGRHPFRTGRRTWKGTCRPRGCPFLAPRLGPRRSMSLRVGFRGSIPCRRGARRGSPFPAWRPARRYVRNSRWDGAKSRWKHTSSGSTRQSCRRADRSPSRAGPSTTTRGSRLPRSAPYLPGRRVETSTRDPVVPFRSPGRHGIPPAYRSCCPSRMSSR